MKNRKSQVQMGENVIILFIFFILLIFAVVFYTRIQSTKTKQNIDIDVTGRGLQIAQRISLLPEVQCTKDNAELFSNCYDEYSIRALNITSGRRESKEYYYDVFGFSLVTVKKIFPAEEAKFVIYNNTKANYTSIITTNVPITLCNFFITDEFGSQKDCSFAVLKVEVYT